MDTAAAAEGDINSTGVDTFGTEGVQRGGSGPGEDAVSSACERAFLGVGA